MRELRIAGTRIADDTPAYVVAELGTNHGGSVETAKQLIDAAAWAGADAVKLQKRDNRTLFTRAMYAAPYASEHAFGATYGEHREALELSWDSYRALSVYAHDLGLAFGATAFDMGSAAGLKAECPMDFYKIASGCLTDTALIEKCSRYGPVLISTGGGTMDDVQRACDAGLPNVAMLQCTATYPCPPSDMNLRVIAAFREALHMDCVVGLSDHQDGWSLAPAAYALGARIFEKHFTLDHNARGSDHRFSLEPEGFRAMVRALRATHEAMGDGVKRRLPSEDAALFKMEKSVVAARPIDAGVPIVVADLTVKSPGGGLPPYLLPEVLGRRLALRLGEDAPVPSLDAVLLWD